jgi:hypothetical protein
LNTAFDASRKYHEKAMELRPSDAYVKGRSAAFYNFSGDPARALTLLDEAGELDPFLHVWRSALRNPKHRCLSDAVR